MKTYSVEIQWNGKIFANVVRATSAADAISVTKAQYPGCTLFGTAIIG